MMVLIVIMTSQEEAREKVAGSLHRFTATEAEGRAIGFRSDMMVVVYRGYGVPSDPIRTVILMCLKRYCFYFYIKHIELAFNGHDDENDAERIASKTWK